MKRKISGLAVLILGALSFCPLSVQARPYTGKITIGTAIWPGYLALYVAQEKGYFKEAGLDVSVTVAIGLAEVSKDYVEGKTQGRANLVFDAVKEKLGGFDHKAVMAFDYSNGSDAILAKKEITSVQDFRGKRIAFESGTLEEFFLTWVLSENNLRLSDIIPVEGNPEVAAQKLAAGEVDVAVTYEPFVSKTLSSDAFHKVYSSADAPGLITDILTFRADFIEQHPETVEAIVTACFKAVDFWKTHPAEAEAIVAQYLNDTPESIAGQLKGVRVLDARDNATAFTFSTGLESLYGSFRRIGKFIRQQAGGVEPLLDTDQLIDKRFIRRS